MTASFSTDWTPVRVRTEPGGSFAAIWDDILPPLPDDVWRSNLAAVATELAKTGGRASS